MKRVVRGVIYAIVIPLAIGISMAIRGISPSDLFGGGRRNLTMHAAELAEKLIRQNNELMKVVELKRVYDCELTEVGEDEYTGEVKFLFELRPSESVTAGRTQVVRYTFDFTVDRKTVGIQDLKPVDGDISELLQKLGLCESSNGSDGDGDESEDDDKDEDEVGSKGNEESGDVAQGEFEYLPYDGEVVMDSFFGFEFGSTRDVCFDADHFYCEEQLVPTKNKFLMFDNHVSLYSSCKTHRLFGVELYYRGTETEDQMKQAIRTLSQKYSCEPVVYSKRDRYQFECQYARFVRNNLVVEVVIRDLGSAEIPVLKLSVRAWDLVTLKFALSEYEELKLERQKSALEAL